MTHLTLHELRTVPDAVLTEPKTTVHFCENHRRFRQPPDMVCPTS
ncbi:hypothetical protein [Streptomyces tauricus]